jgi:hypothetical protein
MGNEGWETFDDYGYMYFFFLFSVEVQAGREGDVYLYTFGYHPIASQDSLCEQF